MSHLEHASPAILEWDGELRLARWSPRAEKLFGWRARDVIGLRPEELPFLAEQERWELRRGLESILAGYGERNASFVRIRTREGIDRPCVWLSYPLLSREERPMSVLSVIHEAGEQQAVGDPHRQGTGAPGSTGTAASISSQARAGASPASTSGIESEFVRSAFRHAPVGIGLIDAGGRWQLGNPALCTLLGYSEQELCGTTFQQIIHPDTPDTGYLAHLIAGEIAAHHIEKHHSTRRGEQHWISLTVLVVRDMLGRPMHFLVLAQNITERKRTEERLKEGRDVAEIANRTKSEFLAMISHEIRTPMNAVIGMNSLLLETELSPAQREYVNTLLNSSNTLLRLINDILDFSKVESGKLDLENQPFDLRGCVEGALRMVAGEMARKGNDASYTIAEGTPSILIGDGTRLQQILVNLLANAVKFTEGGKIAITVATHGNSYGEHELLFAVSDTGIGIRRQHHDRLFKSFSQIGSGQRTQPGGTGLGLAISKLLVEMMRGRIWVESDEGKGSTFYFTIIAEGLKQRHWRESIGALKGKRLLVVDDNEETGVGLAQQLQRFEMASIAVTSLELARELIAQGTRLDAVIVNDGIAGFQPDHILAMAGSGKPGAGVPIILLTATDARFSRTELTSAPSVSFLDRPVRQSDLFNLLLDLFVGQPPPPEQKLPSHSLADNSMASQIPLKILIAEDNLVNQRVASLMLESLGYAPDVAANGIEALDALRRGRYDVVLMDVEMPEMDGLMATAQIRRELPADRQPWIIAMTANAMEGYRNFCLESGMNGYLAKPMRKEQLIDALKEVPGAASAPAAGAPAANSPETADEALPPHPLQLLYDALGTDNPAVINDMITQYLTNTAESIIYIRRKCAERNTTELTRIAHSLKSTSKVFGAEELSDLFAKLERLGQAGALEQADNLLTDIASEFKRIQKRLESEQQPG